MLKKITKKLNAPAAHGVVSYAELLDRDVVILGQCLNDERCAAIRGIALIHIRLHDRT
jgi:hypothetical protein